MCVCVCVRVCEYDRVFGCVCICGCFYVIYVSMFIEDACVTFDINNLHEYLNLWRL